MSRQQDARFIIAGACNPIAVAGVLHKAMRECVAEGKDHSQTTADPAVVLIFDQLAQLMGHPCITDQEVFQKAMQEVGEPT